MCQSRQAVRVDEGGGGGGQRREENVLKSMRELGELLIVILYLPVCQICPIYAVSV